ncbi:MAG: 4-oxalocrotonate tautomerase family enzyme [Granulosicoccus sp.]|jgi:4-oxalocrotonate tautomerase family enzyme
MPVLEVHLLEGYSPDERRRLAESLTDATRMVVPAPADAVTVVIHEMPADNYYRGRTTRQGAAALPDPCAITLAFLDALGSRAQKTAQSFLAADFSMHFPGAEPMFDLQELVEWSKPRYSSIEKHIEGTEAFGSSDGVTVVYCRGSLSGVWADGSSFEGIRFIDRFELVGGKIQRQEVWNDLSEAQQFKGVNR